MSSMSIPRIDSAGGFPQMGEIEMPEPQEPVKIEKLPETIRISNLNLEQLPE